MPKIPTAKVPTLEEFKSWYEALNHLDKMNFDTIVQLPSSLKLISQMPEGQYRTMALYALALAEVLHRDA